VEAERDLIAAGVRREKRQDRIDGMAAARILESYLIGRSAGERD
jgi:RNase H-fold protein (predicted Holliday junction resolvase)